MKNYNFADAIKLATDHGTVYVNIERRSRRGEHIGFNAFTLAPYHAPSAYDAAELRRGAELALDSDRGAGTPLNVVHSAGGPAGRIVPLWPARIVPTPAGWDWERRMFWVPVRHGRTVGDALAAWRTELAERFGCEFERCMAHTLNLSA